MNNKIRVPAKKEESGNGKRKPSLCSTFACSDQCCRYGVDVLVKEYNTLIEKELARPGDFSGQEEDEDGVLLYRTVLGRRGCVFLLPKRGCRLHGTKYKPRVCKIFPRDEEEAKEAYQDGYLPCLAPEPAPAVSNARSRRSTAGNKQPAQGKPVQAE